MQSKKPYLTLRGNVDTSHKVLFSGSSKTYLYGIIFKCCRCRPTRRVQTCNYSKSSGYSNGKTRIHPVIPVETRAPRSWGAYVIVMPSYPCVNSLICTSSSRLVFLEIIKNEQDEDLH